MAPPRLVVGDCAAGASSGAAKMRRDYADVEKVARAEIDFLRGHLDASIGRILAKLQAQLEDELETESSLKQADEDESNRDAKGKSVRGSVLSWAFGPKVPKPASAKSRRTKAATVDAAPEVCDSASRESPDSREVEVLNHGATSKSMPDANKTCTAAPAVPAPNAPSEPVHVRKASKEAGWTSEDDDSPKRRGPKHSASTARPVVTAQALARQQRESPEAKRPNTAPTTFGRAAGEVPLPGATVPAFARSMYIREAAAAADDESAHEAPAFAEVSSFPPLRDTAGVGTDADTASASAPATACASGSNTPSGIGGASTSPGASSRITGARTCSGVSSAGKPVLFTQGRHQHTEADAVIYEYASTIGTSLGPEKLQYARSVLDKVAARGVADVISYHELMKGRAGNLEEESSESNSGTGIPPVVPTAPLWPSALESSPPLPLMPPPGLTY
eukprot:TRINITY_DN24547_c0_g5_i1.p1 TRINITY_DN24547_c0_g5~~TRINITY_DN24547_c0_g5_i1.p1  ORF type:complete len:449 (+),score=76.43 TRINITY_DN24547_c0_g5_i1:77-1423(+)